MSFHILTWRFLSFREDAVKPSHAKPFRRSSLSSNHLSSHYDRSSGVTFPVRAQRSCRSSLKTSPVTCSSFSFHVRSWKTGVKPSSNSNVQNGFASLKRQFFLVSVDNFYPAHRSLQTDHIWLCCKPKPFSSDTMFLTSQRWMKKRSAPAKLTRMGSHACPQVKIARTIRRRKLLPTSGALERKSKKTV